jgi:hypothetical protein
VPWFKVDDSFHAHPKVLATDADALGLWVVAGAWSSSHLTDGFVPDHALPRLLPGSADLCRKLVAAGLWRKVRGGYQFHDWSDFQPSAKDVREMREKRAEAGRKGGLMSARNRQTKGPSSGKQTASKPLHPQPVDSAAPRHADRADQHERSSKPASTSSSKPEARASPPLQPPTRPLPSTKEGRGGGAQCRFHQGQPAHNCALCRSEQLADQEAT